MSDPKEVEALLQELQEGPVCSCAMGCQCLGTTETMDKAAAMIRELLAEGEPVAWRYEWQTPDQGRYWLTDYVEKGWEPEHQYSDLTKTPLYAHPPVSEGEGEPEEYAEQDSEFDEFREQFQYVCESWDRLTAYVTYRAWGADAFKEERQQEWRTTAMRLNKLGQKLRYLMKKIRGDNMGLPAPNPLPCVQPVIPQPPSPPVPEETP